ncbi:hypothetical protein N7462_009479 [Penicillium macrosclerotiorum]|uniref:uncharacterized protein n=1 Tax=Penicillium macrosclerotiorum TaxID=303699 RepID=UPI00254845F5|nr:uncharacterized protein N7462_009479 [Penicillium macrosclerotiorum]KAJ5674040.1 hypothetical protein N7462_009479 [Penicillium macrosclerotiorum]
MSAIRLVPVVRSRVATCPKPRILAIRSISSTAKNEKGPVDATKDTLKKADRVVSDAAVKGINKGEEVGHKLKDVFGSTSAEAKSKAQSMKGDAAEYAGKSKGEAEHAAGKVKGKMEEMSGKAKEAKRTHVG